MSAPLRPGLGPRPRGSDRSRSRRRRSLPLPPHPRPGRRLPGPPQGEPRRASRALRGMARRRAARPAARVRGDPRLPPRAGAPLPKRAGPCGRALGRARDEGGRPARIGGTPSACARRRAGRGGTADARDAPPARRGEGAAGDRRLELRARLEHATIQGRLNPGLGTEALRRTAEEAISVFDQLGDELGLAKAWCRLADVHWMAAQWGARAEAFEKALVHARRAGSARDQSFILASLPISLLYGSTPVPEAIGRIQQILEETPGDRMVEARVLDDLVELHAMLGEFEEARRLYARSKEILEDLGLRLGLAVQTSAGGEIERLAGDPSAAEAELRSGYETLERMGEKAGLSTLAAFLAESIYSQGRHDEAERFTEISEAAAPREDVTSHVYLAGTRAKVLARRTQFEEAERMAREAAERSLETDSVGLQAHALMNLAEVLRFAGRPEEAVPPAEKAVDLYERKGNIVLRGRAQTWLAKLRTALTPTGDTG